MRQLIDFILHIDEHLKEMTASYGPAVYGILFLIVFCETGLVFMPLLPGDSLLFAAGAIAAVGGMNVWVLLGLLIVAAILGDTVNYHVGKYFGPRVMQGKSRWWLNQHHLNKTRHYFEKYGARTIFLARFIPIVRTMAPFVAGVGAMEYRRFVVFNVVGGIVWVAAFLLAGFWFGNMPIVEHNFTLVVLGIIAVSVLPMVVEFARGYFNRSEEAPTQLSHSPAAAASPQQTSHPTPEKSRT